MTAPRVEVRKRRRYASVEIDLWPCGYDMNQEGARRCGDLLKPAAQRALAKQRGAIYFTGIYGGRHSFVSITRVLKEEADEIAQGLLAIVTDPECQQPLRHA